MRPLAALSILIACSGCADERAVVVDVSVQSDGDRMCLVVFAGDSVVWERSYGEATSGSLTLVAGTEVDDRVRVTASVERGGQVLARDSGESAFGTLDSVHLPLSVARCAPQPGRGMAQLRAIGTVEAADGAALGSSDLDGDGRDELVVALADGTIAVAQAGEGEDEITPIDAPIPAGALPGLAASLDADCVPDLLLASPDGAVVLRSPSQGGTTEPAVGPAASSVAAGRLADGTSIAVAGPDGLAVVSIEPESTSTLDAAAYGSVVVFDLTRDGYSDLVASGLGGAVAFLGSGAGPARADGALPPSFSGVTGPLAFGDLNADGALDLVGAEGTRVRVAGNRGDGLLEDRTGTAPPMAAAELLVIAAGDLDGDCRDDVVTLDADGAVSVYRAGAGFSLTAVPLTVGAASDVEIADVDGDGLRELAVLERTGELSVWQR